jgi:hypothetical protein
MMNSDRIDKRNFLYPSYRYRGQFSLPNLMFSANLQEFSQRVCYICNIQTRGKLSPQQAWEQIEEIWQQFQRSSSNLGLEKDAIQ